MKKTTNRVDSSNQLDEQANKQKDRKTDRKTDIQTDRQTERQTDRQRVSYRTFPFGGSKIVGTVFEKINITKGRFWGKNMTSLAPKRGKQCIKRHGVFTQHGVFTI